MHPSTRGVGLDCYNGFFQSKFLKIIWLLCVSLSIVACNNRPHKVYADTERIAAPYNEVPISGNFSTSSQLKLQAAQHWANIANDTGKAISELLMTRNVCTPKMNLCRSVYINPPVYVTEFSRTFHNQLITTMVTKGVSVSKEPEGSILIDIDVQPVIFSANRPQYRYAGVPTELGPGIWALRDVSTVVPSDPQDVPPEPDALHWFRTELSTGRTPQMEIILTVSASDKTHYLARKTNVYYVSDSDRRLYDNEICSLFQTCKKAVSEEKSVVVTPVVAPQKPTRSIEITGDCPLERKCCSTGKPCPEDEIKPKSGKNKA